MYRKSIRALRKERMFVRMEKMRAAKERKRIAADSGAGTWTAHEYLLRFSVSPCGRFVGLRVGDAWERCGSERTIRAVLAKAIWRRTTK